MELENLKIKSDGNGKTTYITINDKELFPVLSINISFLPNQKILCNITIIGTKPDKFDADEMELIQCNLKMTSFEGTMIPLKDEDKKKLINIMEERDEIWNNQSKPP